MRLLRSYCALMTADRPIIRSGDRIHLRARGLHLQTKMLVPEFGGPE
jgi:hypothetical protein